MEKTRKKITKEFLIENGAKQINNSMLRFEQFTFQNTTNLRAMLDGKEFYKGFKLCYAGEFIKNIYTEEDAIDVFKQLNKKY